jgi:hypothetical protein
MNTAILTSFLGLLLVLPVRAAVWKPYLEQLLGSLP